MTFDVAYIAAGRLHVKSRGAEPRAFESKFGQQLRDRLDRMQQRNAWKTQGSGAQFMGGRLLWGMGARDEEGVAVRVRSFTRGAGDGELLYTLDTGDVGGVFAVHVGTHDERRLMHGATQRYRDLSMNARRDRIVASNDRVDGGASLVVMTPDISDVNVITEGDSFDASPAWVEGSEHEIVFESAGIARSADGAILSAAPSVIHHLDLRTGDMKTIAEEKEVDLCQPRMTASGDVYYVRRPRHLLKRRSALRANLDFLMFPFRLAGAILHYLNFFSTRYSGKPLLTAGSRRQRGADIRQMMEWNNLMAADQQARDDDPNDVRSSWQLVRRRGFETKALASRVVAYDLCPDGTVVYSTGSAIFHLDAEGKAQRLCEGNFIEQVMAIAGA